MEIGEVEMWRAVIQQAIKDATIGSSSPEDKRNARSWLSHGGIDFELVCDFADVPSEPVFMN